MPFICLAQSSIPDGTVNILDLFPNTSLRNMVLDPVGQTKYVNRVVNDVVQAQEGNGATVKTANGLGAYLMDKVEPGGLQFATGTIAVAAAAAPDTVTIGGVVFTAVNGVADPANQEFEDVAQAGSDQLSAVSLALAINDAASLALINAANDGVEVAAGVPVAGVITLTADTLGAPGSLTLASSTGVRLAVSDARMARAVERWSLTSMAVATAAIIARMDAGLPLALSNVNTILSAAGAELTSLGGSLSTGSVLELLSILAGRGYRLPGGSVKYSNLYTWVIASGGGFTQSQLVFDPEFNDSPNGTQVAYETKPIRTTYDGGSFQQSLLNGYLSTFAGGVNLYPDSDALPPIVGQVVPINNARVVTVYADDGAVLA